MAPIEIKIIRMSLATIWLVTGFLSLGIYPEQQSLELLARLGLYDSPARIVLYLAAVLNIIFGLLTLFVTQKTLWLFQVLLVLIYTLLIAVWLPEFWLHPFGPILKNIAVLTLIWLLYRSTPASR